MKFDSCRLVIVRTCHIEYLSLKVLFFKNHSLPFIINHPETVNCCNFSFVSTFVGDFGRELSSKRAARLILRIKGKNCDWTDFKMGVAATLPELSEWTSH